MGKVADIFIEEAKLLLARPYEKDNRATWQDGSPVETKRIIQYSRTWDLTQGFPILDLRDINYLGAWDEILWIFQLMSNDTKDLKSNIWNQWKNEDGLIDKAYGYQIGQETMGFPSQIHYLLAELKRNPTTRRAIMNMFNAKQQHTKATKSLIECAYGTEFSIQDDLLHMTLHQRSGDFLTAAGFGQWNTVQYAFLQHAIAREVGVRAGNFKHDIQDLHLYNKHEKYVLGLIKLYEEGKLQDSDLVQIDFSNRSFFELLPTDATLTGYNPLPSIGKFPVAK